MSGGIPNRLAIESTSSFRFLIFHLVMLAGWQDGQKTCTKAPESLDLGEQGIVVFTMEIKSVEQKLKVIVVNCLCFAAGRPLFYISLHLFQQHGFIRQFRLDVIKLMKLLSE